MKARLAWSQLKIDEDEMMVAFDCLDEHELIQEPVYVKPETCCFLIRLTLSFEELLTSRLPHVEVEFKYGSRKTIRPVFSIKTIKALLDFLPGGHMIQEGSINQRRAWRSLDEVGKRNYKLAPKAK